MAFKHPNWLLPAIIVGTLLGIAAGWFFGPQMLVIDWIVGTLFLNALKMIVIPLVLFSLILGVTALGSIKEVGSTGIRTLIYFLATTSLSVGLGLILVNWLQPGVGITLQTGLSAPATGPLSWKHLFLSFVPANIVKAMAEMDVLPVIIFSLLFGISLLALGERGKPLVKIFELLNDTIIQLVHFVLCFAPIGVFALVAAKLGESGGGPAIWMELKKIGGYAATVLLGLSLHGLVALPLILFLFARRNPFVYLYRMSEAMLTAFSTASSSATLPVTMDCVETKNNVSNRSAGFVLPLGATVNMDGTALYEAVAAIFIAQTYGIEMTLTQQLIIFLTATLASIGAPGIPQAGLVTMVLVLKAVGLPLEGIALILTVDWLLDRFRTMINVWGDAVGAAVVERYLPHLQSSK
ncbi:MAG: dicarboxylate/amino acid:cation symporter [Deltaproteobacteria bacterium]|nr:dicarboxylate/amino acid:cation symporter [Deltaproteobacteria bacterium]